MAVRSVGGAKYSDRMPINSSQCGLSQYHDLCSYWSHLNNEMWIFHIFQLKYEQNMFQSLLETVNAISYVTISVEGHFKLRMSM